MLGMLKKTLTYDNELGTRQLLDSCEILSAITGSI